MGDPLPLLNRKSFNPTLQESQPVAFPFGAGVEQQLKPETDPEDRTLLLPPALQVGNQPGGLKVLHSGVEGADPREDEGIAALELVGS